MERNGKKISNDPEVIMRSSGNRIELETVQKGKKNLYINSDDHPEKVQSFLLWQILLNVQNMSKRLDLLISALSTKQNNIIRPH